MNRCSSGEASGQLTPECAELAARVAEHNRRFNHTPAARARVVRRPTDRRPRWDARLAGLLECTALDFWVRAQTGDAGARQLLVQRIAAAVVRLYVTGRAPTPLHGPHASAHWLALASQDHQSESDAGPPTRGGRRLVAAPRAPSRAGARAVA